MHRLSAESPVSQLLELLAVVERPVPLEQWQREVLALYKSRARSTRLRMGQAVREAIALAGPDATTAALTTELVDRFAQREGRAATVNGLLSALRTACRIAARKKWLSRSRLEEAKWRVPSDPPRTKHHSRAAIARVLTHLRADSGSWAGHRLYAFAAVLAYTGLRKNEALRLRVEDVDLVRGFVHVRPNGSALKTAASEAPVPLCKAVVAILKAWLPLCGSDWVFPTSSRRGPWTGGSTGRRAADRLKAAGLAADVEGFTPHSLRHSLATHLATHWRLGAKQIRMMLRHTSDRTQVRYIHPELEDLRAMVVDFDFAEAPGAPTPAARPKRRLRRPKRTVR